MIEFMVVAVMVIAIWLLSKVFLDTIKDNGTRVLSLVGSEYP